MHAGSLLQLVNHASVYSSAQWCVRATNLFYNQFGGLGLPRSAFPADDTHLVPLALDQPVVRACCDAEDVGCEPTDVRPLVSLRPVLAVHGEASEGVHGHQDVADVGVHRPSLVAIPDGGEQSLLAQFCKPRQVV